MSFPLPSAWPEALAGTPAVAVIERAIERRRLSHSLLLSGGDLAALTAVAWVIADRLLNTPAAPAAFPPEQYPDCFILRPTKKSRQIGADDTRELIGKVQVSPAVSPHKVAIILECDRMNTAAANIFLKTLEEPPGHTTLLLVTTKPHTLLPTIRSRCLHFRFPLEATPLAVDGWAAWKDDYLGWLKRLPGLADRKEAGEVLVVAYGLIARCEALLSYAADVQWKALKPTLPEELTHEEEEAMAAGISNGLRVRFFTEIEMTTREFALPFLHSEDEALSRSYARVITHLEKTVGLLKVNLNESAVLEDFLLTSMRLWARSA